VRHVAHNGSMSSNEPSRRGPEPRAAYAAFRPITTRWMDNDVYGHVNNVVYYAYFDTVINQYLIEQGGLDIAGGDTIGLCVESHCAYLKPVAFPETIEAGLRVAHLGRSSVRYEIGIFGQGQAEPSAHGWFVHVFVDRATRRPAPLPEPIRACLARLTAQNP
jgi:acyl-CoA thioester hydrolase